jgi:choline-glycine betaine transporter
MAFEDSTVYIFFFLLAIVLVVLGSIITSGANKISDADTKSATKNSGVGVLVMGLLFLLGSGAMLYSKYGHKLSGGYYYF